MRRKDVCAVPVEEKASSRPMLTQNRLAEIKARLAVVRRDLAVIQRFDDAMLYGIALAEYAKVLGELEPYSQDKARYFNG